MNGDVGKMQHGASPQTDLCDQGIVKEKNMDDLSSSSPSLPPTTATTFVETSSALVEMPDPGVSSPAPGTKTPPTPLSDGAKQVQVNGELSDSGLNIDCQDSDEKKDTPKSPNMEGPVSDSDLNVDKGSSTDDTTDVKSTAVEVSTSVISETEENTSVISESGPTTANSSTDQSNAVATQTPTGGPAVREHLAQLVADQVEFFFSR